MGRKVNVKSTVEGMVGVKLPELHFARTWPKKGTVIPIDIDILKEGMYDNGLRVMLQEGILYIENMQDKIELDLEPEGAETPQEIIVLSDKEKLELLKDTSLIIFKERLAKLSKTQVEELAEYAITNEILDLEKSKVIKNLTGRDIIKAVQLNRDSKEA